MIHVFGCSFTYGTGLRSETQGSLPMIQTEKYSNYIWPILLEQRLGEKVINHGKGGAGNGYIREQVIRNLEHIKKGDQVIIGTTSSTRIHTPFYHTRKKRIEYLHVIPSTVEDVLERSKKAEKLHLNGSYFDREYLLSVSNYYIELMKNYEDFLDSENMNMFKSLQVFLTNVGVRCTIWDRGMWWNLETISQWSKNEYLDGHWSPNGHRFFSLILEQSLKEDVDFNTITNQKFKRLYRAVLPKYLENTYVKYEP